MDNFQRHQYLNRLEKHQQQQLQNQLHHSASNLNSNKHHTAATSTSSHSRISDNHNTSMSGRMQQQPTLIGGANFFTLGPYKRRKDLARSSVTQEYEILGYIAAGTYGKVYKARYKAQYLKQQGKKLPGTESENAGKLFAIKKFKSDSKDGEISHYTGISQSAIREMSLCRDLVHENIVQLSKIILERKCIYMVSEFAEHDLLQIIHYHSQPSIRPIPEQTLKSIIYQTLNGVSYLHQNWVLHRDLKPLNIMVNSNGVVKIGDLGLLRKFNNLLQSLYLGDKVVVTIWYRAPELLLGSRHYTALIDIWAVGCILLELLSLRPIFKGEELKIDNRKQVPFQENQMLKILEILGTPNLDKWPNLLNYPEYQNLSRFLQFPLNLSAWYHSIGGTNKNCLKLLSQLLEYDPLKRLQLYTLMDHQWFHEQPRVQRNIFENSKFNYPDRKIQKDDNDILSGSGSGIAELSRISAAKRSYVGNGNQGKVDDGHMRKKMALR